MRHKGPSHAVDAWQPGQGLVHQDREGAEIAAWQPLVNFLELCLDQVEIVEQPFCCRADVIARRCLQTNVGVRFAQHLNIAFETRKKSGGT